MGFKLFWLAMKTREDVAAPAFATAIPAMFEALLDVFAPLEVALQIDGNDFRFVERIDPQRTFGTQPLWFDEELTREPLTRCIPALGADVIAELYDRLHGIDPTTFYVAAEGALRHRAADTDEPAWYGRWRLKQTLHELARVTFTWTSDPLRGFELSCPLSGYPFSSAKPLVRGELVDGDPALAAQNRALWLPALCRVREALGFDRGETEWEHGGDYGWVYKRDSIEIAKAWMPALRDS